MSTIQTDVHSDVREFHELSIELRRLRKQTRDILLQKKQCESRILQYLTQYEHPGIRAGEVVIMAHELTRQKRQGKKHKMVRGQAILEKHGILNSHSVMEELLTSLRGSPEIQQILKIKE
jgi:hypothetical protein